MPVIRSAMASLVSKVVPVYLKQSARDINDVAVEKAVSLLTSGRIIGLPTDTIYGLACSAQSSAGVSSLYRIKERDLSKPIAVCVADIDDLSKWSRVTVGNDILRDLLPGAVTLVFNRLNSLNSQLNPGTDLIGIRIPDNEFIRTVARKCGFPIALTSANLSSWKSSLSVDEFEDLWPSLDAVFDGGRLGAKDPERLGSTVVDLSQKGQFRIIREGCAGLAVKTILKEKYDLIDGTEDAFSR